MKRGHWIGLMMLMMAMTIWSAPALARTAIDETLTADPQGVVTIENLMGSVTVTGWDRDEVSVTGYLGDAPEDLEIESHGDEISIVVVWPERTRRRDYDPDEDDTDLTVKVPRGSEVSVEGVNTSIDISDVEGEVEAASVNGDIAIRGGSGEVDAETVNGRIEIDTRAESVEAETVNGPIVIEGDQEEVSAATVNGSIEVSGDALDSGEFSSVNGDITYTGDLDKRGSFEFESHSGTVILYLPGNVSADFDVETFSGKIHNDFGPQAEKVSKYGPGYELRFTAGSGSAQVSISSFSGRVEIRKR